MENSQQAGKELQLHRFSRRQPRSTQQFQTSELPSSSIKSTGDSRLQSAVRLSGIKQPAAPKPAWFQTRKIMHDSLARNPTRLGHQNRTKKKKKSQAFCCGTFRPLLTHWIVMVYVQSWNSTDCSPDRCCG